MQLEVRKVPPRDERNNWKRAQEGFEVPVEDFWVWLGVLDTGMGVPVCENS